ncbi:hypothetical protein ACFO3J_35365 [Streptomyces polygonati]|uniref:Tetratricopeptide repeat protein n=1 Tax=Streptomyces polygonati TaxID=1617087 RepID=A0ABV8HY58_9ACTN
MPTAPRTTDELQQALIANQQLPYGRTRTVGAEELVDAAEQFDEPIALVRTLLELQSAYVYGSEPRKSPVVFARLLTLFDEHPDLFDERLRHELFWRFKWVANALRQLPEMPLASIQQWLTEMRARYEKAGLGLQPYYGQAYQLAAHVGQDSAPAYELWAARTRTPLSDCEACEICERALYQLHEGDDEGALDTWEPVLAGTASCQEEPARSVSYALLPLLRTGRTDRARELHLAGYRACRHRPSMSGEVGRHLEFCALTGNEARGLELLAENRGLFDEVESPHAGFDFLTGVEVLLQRVERLGHGELPVAGYAGRVWSVAELRAEVRARADDLATRFDARNGTTAHTDRRRARLDRAPLLDALELTLRTRGLGVAAQAGPAAAPAGRTPAPVSDTLPELILQARNLDERAHPDANACWARLRALVAAPDYAHPDDPAVGSLVRLRADLLADEATLAYDKDEYAVAATLFTQAGDLYEEAGERGHAAFARGYALLAEAEKREKPAEPVEPAEGAGGAEGPEKTEKTERTEKAEKTEGADLAQATEAKVAALSDVHAAVVRLQEDTPDLAPYQEARLLRLRATALVLRLQTSGSEEHAAPVLAEADLLRTFATLHSLVSQISGARFLRATTHAVCGDLPAARTEVDGLLDELEEHGPAWHLPRALGLRARLRLGLGEAPGAHADLTEALRLAADWPAEAVHTSRLHGDLAEACMHLGRPDEALRHLTRSAELELRADRRAQAFNTYGNAAALSLDLGRVEDSIALLDSLLAEPEAATGELDDRLLAQLRLTRARALHAGEDLKAATAEFVALAAESAGWDDDPGSHAMIAAETAVLLGEAGEFGPARQAAEQALAAHARAPRYEQLSNSLRELARLQAEQQGPDGLAGALAFLTDADRIASEARAAGFEARGRSLDTALAYEHGRVNAYAGAYEDALAALDKALDLIGEPAPGDDRAGEWAECVRLAAVVEGIYLKRAAPALTRLDAAITRLTSLGRTDEATSLTSLATRLRDGK